jgi:L-fuculose-phosphate aldolase
MKQVISLRDLEEMVRNRKDPRSLPENAILTPSARDFLRDYTDVPPSKQPPPATPAAPAAANGRGPAKTVTANGSKTEIEAFFHSAPVHDFKLQICDIGRRLWQRAYVDANGGNIAVKVSEDLVLCTPTLISKGFMKPEDMCLVDMEGNQLAGARQRTSEILMHLQMMKRQPRIAASVHCHPPYSTAFAVAGVLPPTCMIPEFEVFDSVGIAPYRTPGTPEMGKLVADLVDKHNTILMANHGVVSWSHTTIEDAYFKMEILEAYCRTVLVASQLGKPSQTMTPQQLKDLLKIKQNLGIPDPRYGLKECELCDNDGWRPGVTCAVPAAPSVTAKEDGDTARLDPQIEALVQTITDQILARKTGPLPAG